MHVAYRTEKQLGDDAKQTLDAIKQMLKGRAVVLIYATWCGHCHVFRPEWQKLVRRLQKRNGGGWATIEIEFSVLERIKTVDKRLFRKLVGDPDRPVYVPMILGFEKNKRTPYDGERTADAIEADVLKDSPSYDAVRLNRALSERLERV